MAGAAVGGAVIGAVSDMIGGLITLSAQKKEAKKQRKFARFMYEHRYRMTMADMRAAGLNPILAAGIGGGGGPAPQGSMANISPLPTSGATRGAAVGAQVSKLKQEKSLLEAQKEASSALASKASAEAALTAGNTPALLAKTAGEASSAVSQAASDKVREEWLKTPAGRAAAEAQLIAPKLPGSGIVGTALEGYRENKQSVADWLKKQF